MDDNRVMTAREAGDVLRVTPATIRLWIANGKLPAARVSERGLRIPAAAVFALLQK